MHIVLQTWLPGKVSSDALAQWCGHTVNALSCECTFLHTVNVLSCITLSRGSHTELCTLATCFFGQLNPAVIWYGTRVRFAVKLWIWEYFILLPNTYVILWCT